MTNLIRSPAGISFAFPTASNRNYTVNWSTLGPQEVWETLTNVHGNGALAEIRDPATPDHTRFYRVFAESPVRYLTVGHVSPTTARLAVGLDAPRDLYLIYSTDPGLADWNILGPFPVSVTDDFTRAIDITGLTPGTSYYFNLLVDSQLYYSMPYPNFRTQPPLGTPGMVKFGFGSCFRGTGGGGYGTIALAAPSEANDIWQAIVAKEPNFFLHLGDTAYCDNMGANDLKGYRLVHRHGMDERLPNMAGYAFYRRHFSFYCTLDDHEIRNDWPWDPNASAPFWAGYLGIGRQAFHEYSGRANPDPLEPGELYYNLQFRDVGFFVTDTRSFRSCQEGDDSLADIPSEDVALTFNGQAATATGRDWNGGLGFTAGLVGRTLRLANGQTRYVIAQNSPTQISVSPPGLSGTYVLTVLGKTVLGAPQKQHLKDWLLQNKNTLRVKFIATATGINGLTEHVTRKDAWGAGYQAELYEIMDFITANQIRNVVFLGGDQHWAGSFNRPRNGVNFFEFMSSPLFAFPFPKYSDTNQVLLSRVNWMFDLTDNHGRSENFGLVTVQTDTPTATIKFELFDPDGMLLNSTSLREGRSGLELAP